MSRRRPPYREIIGAVAEVVSPTGIRVGDLPTPIQCWVDDGCDGDELGDALCRLVTGEYVYLDDSDRVHLRGMIRIAGYAR